VGAGVQVSATPAKAVRAAKVSHVRTTDDRISFDVDEPGTPVLVKVSYFPNWQASGANGPWRVAPNLMVVVPTSTHVSLHYGRTAVDWLGWVFTLLGVAGVVWLWRTGPVEYAERRDDEDERDDLVAGERTADDDELWAPPEHERVPQPTHFLTPEPGSS
jgi:hypothetical protein